MRELSQNVADFTELLRYFRNKILPDGTLDDRASPELARIRRDIERQRRDHSAVAAVVFAKACPTAGRYRTSSSPFAASAS